MTASNNTSTTPEFISLDEAAAMTTGTRVTFIPGIPALYSEALKNICYAKGVPLIRALHPMMGVDKATGQDRQARLLELTSQTSLPTMFHNDERPRNVWTEQLALAESIGSEDSPRIIPDDFEERVTMYGLCAIVLGEDGFVWNMRILGDNPLGRKYGYSEDASASAPKKMAEVVDLIARRLEAQEKDGSRYLVGDSVSAADIYWATMSMSLVVPPPEIMPVTKQNQGMLKGFSMSVGIPGIAEVLTDRVEAHQRYILTTYCETPAVLGGDAV